MLGCDAIGIILVPRRVRAPQEVPLTEYRLEYPRTFLRA